MLEKTLESPLDYKEIKPVNPLGNQPWIFIGGTAAEAEAPILWPPKVKSQLTGKDCDARKDWGQEEKRVAEDEMVGWHHWLDECESEWTPGVGDGQGGLACCSSWGRKESAQLSDWTELKSKTMGCFSGCLMSSAYIQKLFCGISSAFKCSFDEFVRKKVVSLSYSSAILGLPPKLLIISMSSIGPWRQYCLASGE